MSKETNNVAKMQALYQNQVKLACLNNFYNQRRQQLMYAAYLIAQNKLRNRGFMHIQQNLSNCMRPHQNYDNLMYSQNMFNVSKNTKRNFFQPKHKQFTTNKVRRNTIENFKSNDLNKNHRKENMII